MQLQPDPSTPQALMLVLLGHNSQPLCLHASCMAKASSAHPPPLTALPGTHNNSRCRITGRLNLDSTPVTKHIYKHCPSAVGMAFCRHACYTMLGGGPILLHPPGVQYGPS